MFPAVNNLAGEGARVSEPCVGVFEMVKSRRRKSVAGVWGVPAIEARALETAARRLAQEYILAKRRYETAGHTHKPTLDALGIETPPDPPAPHPGPTSCRVWPPNLRRRAPSGGVTAGLAAGPKAARSVT